MTIMTMNPTRIVAKNGNDAGAGLAQLEWNVVSLDTETTALEYDKLEAIGYSVTDGKTVVYVDLNDQPQGLRILGEFLKRTKTVIMHNAVFDAKVLYKYGVKIDGIEWFDTLVASHLIDENRVDRRIGGKGHGLKTLATEFLDADPVLFEDAEAAGVHSEKFYEYAQNDALWTWELAHIFRVGLEEQELVPLFRDIEMPFLKTLLEMELNGIQIDQAVLMETTEKLRDKIQHMHIDLHKLAQVPYQIQMSLTGEMAVVSDTNFNSTKQLLGVFNKLGLEVTETTKTGNLSVGKTTLSKLKDKHPFVAALDEYRAANKLLTAFFEPLPQFIDRDGRVRPNFRDTGTVTGRLSCDKPNLQQLPKENKKLGIQVRSVFVAPPGKKLIACDYSQQELRIMTELSRDPALIKVILEDGDLHLINANTVFNLGIPEEKLYASHPEFDAIKKKHKKDRDKGKVFSFGIPYGMGPHKLARDFNVSMDEAENLLANFFAGFPALEQAIKETHKQVQSNLYVTTYTGRRRHFKLDERGRLDGKSLRQSFNFLIQSYGADLIRKACIKISDYAKKHPEYGVKLLITVHDEVVLEAWEIHAEKVAKDVEQLMESCADMVVPLKAEASVGDNYGQIK